MDVKAVYEQKEIRLGAGDWEQRSVGSVAQRIMDFRGRTPRKLGMEWGGGDIPALSAGNVRQGFIDFSRECYCGSEALYRRWMTQGDTTKDDIVFTTEAPLGNVALIPDHRKYILSQRTVLLRVDPATADARFLFHIMQSGSFQTSLRDHASGSTAKGIQRSKLEQLALALPPLHEQRVIAEALGDVDDLLAGLDRLIAKKRNLKQAAMQQLLTGQTRLPGYRGAWEAKTLGDLFDFSGGYTASRDQLSASGHCYLHYGDIHKSARPWIDAALDYNIIPKLDVPLSRVSPGSLLADGDVVFVDASEDDAGASKHVVVVNKDRVPFISGLHTIVAKGKTEELTHEYRRHCFQTAAIRRQFLFYAVGTKVSGISKKNIARLELPFPNAPEQLAIAGVLSDMDAELAALDTRRAKTRALKQAVMQELLTGRIRLV